MNLNNQSTDEEIQAQIIEQEIEEEKLMDERREHHARMSKLSNKPVVVSREWFEHLLNCLANQKTINELTQDKIRINQEIIDDTWRDGMAILREENYTSWRSPMSPL